jgi:hypothetical protein
VRLRREDPHPMRLLLSGVGAAGSGKPADPILWGSHETSCPNSGGCRRIRHRLRVRWFGLFLPPDCSVRPVAGCLHPGKPSTTSGRQISSSFDR